ncbi:hypothetical protein K1T71_013201 [Dendrolimus kikuchii]|uniref:Uncharacterized protein n=1 Tax=Dendrolimus kikuchii TaxID=765133 RepID=A0ACC1CHF3_9NEOP|nr:hypothetical protein K1T71_013201 [Dendrolimus kikuchii]
MTLMVILLSTVSYTESAKILAVYPVPSISHQSAFRPLTLELIRRGHEVMVVTTDPIYPEGKTPENLTEIGVHDISYKIWRDIVKKSTGNKNDMAAQVAGIFELVNKVCDAQFETEEIKDIIRNKRNYFDILLIESCVRPPLAFTHIMKVPVIQVSSFGNWIWNYEIAGAPTHPILYPTMTNQRSYNLSLWEKILEVFNIILIKCITYITEETDLEMMRKHFGDDLPNIKELMDNVDMLFLNVHPIWENNRPVPANVVYMGGIHLKPPKELPMSTDEAIAAGVPVIGTPMLADQWFNVENIVKNGIGLKLDIGTITEDALNDAIDKILSNDSYEKNVARLRDLMYDQPQKPLDRAIRWIEHVLRHKSAKHLRSPAANMSMLEYIQIEVITVVCVMALLFVMGNAPKELE